tara:strand:- start:116 stop:382 length:267 start_codon:yes stop_codon:yes gene_type:complete
VLSSSFYQEKVILVAFAFRNSSVLDLLKAIICSTPLKGMQTRIIVINGFIGAGKRHLSSSWREFSMATKLFVVMILLSVIILWISTQG